MRFAPITTTRSGAYHSLAPILPKQTSRADNHRGEHIHHGYFLEPTDTKEKAQIQLIELLLERSKVPAGSTVLDVGCGIGGTSRYLAKEYGCHITGVTISGRQVEIAKKLSGEVTGAVVSEKDGSVKLGDGSVRFLELDAEKMGDYFTAEPNTATFDCVWISEAMSHLPNKELFFRNAALLLKLGGKLVVADWFKNEGLTEKQMDADIKPIEGTVFGRVSIKSH
jgi:tocopherol O-methyltransferase